MRKRGTIFILRFIVSLLFHISCSLGDTRECMINTEEFLIDWRSILNICDLFWGHIMQTTDADFSKSTKTHSHKISSHLKTESVCGCLRSKIQPFFPFPLFFTPQYFFFAFIFSCYVNVMPVQRLILGRKKTFNVRCKCSMIMNFQLLNEIHSMAVVYLANLLRVDFG